MLKFIKKSCNVLIGAAAGLSGAAFFTYENRKTGCFLDALPIKQPVFFMLFFIKVIHQELVQFHQV